MQPLGTSGTYHHRWFEQNRYTVLVWIISFLNVSEQTHKNGQVENGRWSNIGRLPFYLEKPVNEGGK